MAYPVTLISRPKAGDPGLPPSSTRKMWQHSIAVTPARFTMHSRHALIDGKRQPGSIPRWTDLRIAWGVRKRGRRAGPGSDMRCRPQVMKSSTS